MRRPLVLATLLLVAVTCSGHPAAAPSSPPSVVTSSAASPTVSQAPPATPSLPPGVPAAYDRNVAPGDVPLSALIPPHTTVEGSWYATVPAGLPAGDAIVVAYETPSNDPFHAARGLVIWRRFDVSPYWRATFGLAHAADEGVLSIGVLVADVTGDGSPDALVMESTGGSGSCATWRVVDLAEGTQVWQDALCDAQVVPSTDPVGLTLTEAVFTQNDAHCCPSATRTTILVYAGSPKWTVAARKVTPNG